MVRTLILLQTRAEVESIGAEAGVATLVAWGPDAAMALEEKGTPFRTIDDYWPIGPRNAARAELLEGLIAWKIENDGAWERRWGRHPLWREWPPVGSNFYQWVSILQADAIGSALLRRMIEKVEPDRIVLYDAGDSFLPRLVGRLHNAKALSSIQIEIREPCDAILASYDPLPPRREPFRIARSISRRLFRLHLEWKARIRKLLGKWGNGDDIRILGIAPFYDASAIIEDFVRRGDPVWAWTPLSSPRPVRRGPGGGEVRVELPPDLAPPFVREDVVSTWEALERTATNVRVLDVGALREVGEAFAEKLLRTARSAPRVEAAMKAVRPDLLLGSSVTEPIESLIVAVAKSEEIPYATIQHGGSYGYSDVEIHLHLESSLASAFFTYGPGVVRRFRRAEKRIRRVWGRMPVLYAEGSPRMDNLGPRRTRAELGIPADAFVFLYPVSGITGVAKSYGFPSDFRWFALERELVDIFRDRSEREILLVKEYMSHTGPYPLLRHVRRSGNSRVRFLSSDVVFSSLFDLPDVVILTMPSTTLLETLQTDRPILCYLDPDSPKLFPEALELLRRRCVVETEWGAFRERILACLDRRDDEAFRKATDPSFRLEYANAAPGRALSRTIAALRAFVRREAALSSAHR